MQKNIEKKLLIYRTYFMYADHEKGFIFEFNPSLEDVNSGINNEGISSFKDSIDKAINEGYTVMFPKSVPQAPTSVSRTNYLSKYKFPVHSSLIEALNEWSIDFQYLK